MIRRARPADHDWIRDTAAEVYRALGDYRTIIPSWLDHEGVLSFVDESDSGDALRGFTLVGFYAPVDEVGDALIADLLAIGVAPAYQRQGIGRAMLAHAVDVARAAGGHRDIPEIRLTVAEHNDGARALFDAAGFVVLHEDYGTYDHGQRAIRMTKRL